jgi:hypothetical protein
MPRGGARPGAGAPKGNTNAVSSGNTTQRARELLLAFKTHPNMREIFRIGYILGLFGTSKTYDIPRNVRLLHPAVFDPTHPWFNQINKRPEAGFPNPRFSPPFTDDELRRI